MDHRKHCTLCTWFLVSIAIATGCFVDRSGVTGLTDGDPRKGCIPECNNGGVCVGTECFCGPVDYEGPTCDERIDDCKDVDCGNGTCLDGVRAHACDCDQAWTIDAEGRCTVPIVDCTTPNACVQGKCDDSSGIVTCDCDPGFHGMNCNAPINCGIPPETPANAIVGDITGTEFGSIVTYECLAGFGSDAVTVMCQADGTWESFELSCMPIECGIPRAIANGTVNLAGGTTYGSVVTYDCNPGFVLYGASTRVCSVDGNWSGPEPVCYPQGSCSDDPCVNGFCITRSSTSFQCYCGPGWTGILCEADVDECAGGIGPCSPFGSWSCWNYPGGYGCECRAGWEGSNCDAYDQ